MTIRLRLSPLALICQLILVHAQRNGFVSIDCGATSGYTDEVGIEWTTDEPYTASGTNVLLKSLVTARTNQRQVSTLRYFTAKRSKHCYNLPAFKGARYLVRASFMHGGFEPVAFSTFSLSVKSCTDEETQWTPQQRDLSRIEEFVVRASTDNIMLCLVPKVGYPFINAIELRPLSPGMYTYSRFDSADYDLLSDNFLKKLHRLNLGASAAQPPVRYPDDPYDRIWWPNYTFPNLTAKNMSVDIDMPQGIHDNPPAKVMETGLTASSPILLHFTIDDQEYWIHPPMLVYVNIFASVNEGPPDFNITLNGELVYANSFPSSHNFSYLEAHDTFSILDPIVIVGITDFANLQAHPFVNAVEIYAVRGATAEQTFARDVEALEAIKAQFNLQSWVGDPCLPVSFDWITCLEVEKEVLRVTKINLSNMNLSGMISPKVGFLTFLIELRLNNNNIEGVIPELRSLSQLKILLLQNNSMSGDLPSALATLPALSVLDVSNNNLSGSVPAPLAAKKGLDLRTNGNPNLTGGREDIDGSGNGDTIHSGVVIGAVVVGGLVLTMVTIAAIIWFCYRWKRKKTLTKPIFLRGGPEERMEGGAVVMQAQEFTLAEVCAATSNFEKMIGEGGYGCVYHGKLGDGIELAVKVHANSSGQGHREFINEVSLLSRVRHRNLLSLLGYCDEKGQQILIYEYMAQGTLREHLYGKDMKGCLSWRQRLNVALNAAKGLEYLHNAIAPRIIHRDIKSTNILLNNNLEAKVADFGVSKVVLDGQTTGITTGILGTLGYLDPEYFENQRLSQKSDVYSFGVVLLEIICGKPPSSPDSAGQGVTSLVDWVRNHLYIADVEGIVDPSLRGTYSTKSLEELANLAMECVQPQGEMRPTISRVIRVLASLLDLEKMTGSTSSPSFSRREGGWEL